MLTNADHGATAFIHACTWAKGTVLMSARGGWKWLATLKKWLCGEVKPGSAAPNRGAAALLKDATFQRRALSPGTECSETAEALQRAAGGKIGGTLSISPAEGATEVIHPTKLGLATSKHHQVYTDGEFVYDPLYKDTPIPRTDYEANLRELNGPTVEIGFFGAQSSEDMP